MRRVSSTDGVEMALHFLDGSAGPGAGRRTLLFVHATGFCAAVFSPLAARLAAVGPFHCAGVDLRGHGYSTLPRPPGTDHIWRGFSDDVLAAVDGLGVHPAPGPAATGRLLGVGHSSGGAALLMAEAARPGTFAGLWCFEPIVWPEPEQAQDLARRLAVAARRRRDRFASRRQAYDHFAAKPPFSQLDPAVLQAYVDEGFADEPEGSVSLRCLKEVEADVYLRALDDDRFHRLAEVRCPVVVACGSRSDAIPPATAGRLVDALPSGRLRTFDGLGHFGPLEAPGAVAAAILEDFR